jgi:hypothetical protein
MVAAALGEHFAEAKRARDLADKVREELVSRAAAPDTTELRCKTESQESRRAHWVKVMADFREDVDRAQSDLLRKHEAERAEFEALWRTQKPREYQRPTRLFLELKRREEMLAAAGDIDGAETVHREVERCAFSEAVGVQERLDRDYRSALQRLASRHQAELATFQAASEHRRIAVETRLERYGSCAKARMHIVNTHCTRGPKPRLPEPAKAAPVRCQPGHVAGVLLPELQPPNDPGRNRHRAEECARRARMQRDLRSGPAYASLPHQRPRPEEESEAEAQRKRSAGARAARPWESEEEAGDETAASDAVCPTKVHGVQLAGEAAQAEGAVGGEEQGEAAPDEDQTGTGEQSAPGTGDQATGDGSSAGRSGG